MNINGVRLLVACVLEGEIIAQDTQGVLHPISDTELPAITQVFYLLIPDNDISLSPHKGLP